MYDFQSRIPIDHVLSIYRNVKEGQGVTGDNLQLAGATLGEVGALVKDGLKFPVTTLENVTHDDMMSKLAELENQVTNVGDSTIQASFDITPYLPYILMLIEWFLKRSRA